MSVSAFAQGGRNVSVAPALESTPKNQLIHGTRRFLSEHQFFLGSLTPRITIRFYLSFDMKQVEYEQSHFIHTPLQIGAYHTSVPFGDDEVHALRRAQSDLTEYYGQAVRAGHEPNDNWLEKNPDFS
jgi:hypothetical protein